jgi:hypothetical protein
MGCRSNDQLRERRFRNLSSPAAAAGVSFSDSIFLSSRDALCDSEKARVRLAFPWISCSFSYSYSCSDFKKIYLGAELGKLEACQRSQARCLTSVIGAGAPGG